MKQAALNVIGYSSFSALVLIGHAAQAQVVPVNPASASPIYPKYVEFAVETSADNADCGCQATIDPGSDTVGDLAIEKLGCDCAGCRNMVIQRIQAEAELNQ